VWAALMAALALASCGSQDAAATTSPEPAVQVPATPVAAAEAEETAEAMAGEGPAVQPVADTWGDEGGYGGLGLRGGGGAARTGGAARGGADQEIDDLLRAPVDGASRPRRARDERGAMGTTTVGTTATATATPPPPPPRAQAATALPQSGVLASTFVGGHGAAARLEDLLDRGVMVDGERVQLAALGELGTLFYPRSVRDAVGLHAEMERTRVLEGGERVHLQIALMAREGEAPPRPRMDVRLVLDRSGSMSGEKWQRAVQAAHALVDRLRPTDTFGLVSYSDSASVDLAPARVGDRRAAHAAIDALEIGGGTNIESALRAAYADAPRRRAASDVLLVLLLSDGVANVGLTGPDELAELAHAEFDRSGVLTTAVGVGTDFSEETMLGIAREGSGSYHFVRRPADIEEILGDELEQRALSVAQDLRLRIELAEGVVARRVYGSQLLDEAQAARVRQTEVAVDARLARELGIARDRERDVETGLRMHIPTFRRGDQHVVLMELEVPAGHGALPVARVLLDYKDLARESNEHAVVDVRAERTADAEVATASTVRPVKRTVLAFQAGDALQAAATALGTGDVFAARQALAERIELLRAGATLWRDEALARDADLLGRYDRVLAAAWDGLPTDDRRALAMAMNYYGDRRMR
jgi:Ca-activated chloride channel homolog